MANTSNAKKLIRQALDAGQDELTETALSTAFQVIENMEIEIDIQDALITMRKQPLNVVTVCGRCGEPQHGV